MTKGDIQIILAAINKYNTENFIEETFFIGEI